MELLSKILALALLCYFLLAVGVNLIAYLAPVPRKPLLNATLLSLVVIGFLSALTILMVH